MSLSRGWGFAGCCALQRLHVFDELEQLLFRDQALKGRHDRLTSRSDLCGRIQDRLADVRLVDELRLTALNLLHLTEQPLQDGPSTLCVWAMAGVAREILKELFAGRRQRSFRRSTAEPDLVVRWFHHDDFANHP